MRFKYGELVVSVTVVETIEWFGVVAALYEGMSEPYRVRRLNQSIHYGMLIYGEYELDPAVATFGGPCVIYTR